MTIEQTKKLAAHIFRLLKVSEIVFPIGRTNKGNLGLKFSANNDEYEIMLDAVPLSTKDFLNDENNIELKKMLEKYWFEPVQLSYQGTRIIPDEPVETTNIVPRFESMKELLENEKGPNEAIFPPKKRGRPAGSKNGKASHKKAP